MKKEKQKYWYKTIFGLCPICGEEDVYKYRVYGEKPKDYKDRIEHIYIKHYCYV